jgi:hypothetical protein
MAGAAHPRESSGAMVPRLGVKCLGWSGKTLGSAVAKPERGVPGTAGVGPQ